MTGVRPVLGRAPPFLAGAAAAVAMETSAGLLLYTDRGLLPALTVLLTMESAALGLGLWSGHISLGRGAVDQVRRRWLLALVAFSIAAAFSMGLGFRGEPPGTGVAQGLGLAFLGSFPLFSVGSLLGSMARIDDLGLAPVSTVGIPSVLGAAAGFLMAGTILLPSAAPHTIYLFCLVALSGGALLQGWVLDGRPAVEVREAIWTSSGDLRVEERILGSPRREILTLMEEGRLRGAEGSEGRFERGWEAAVLEGLKIEPQLLGPAVYLGGGSGTLARSLLQSFPQIRLCVVERQRELVDLARAHFAEWDGWSSLPLRFEDPMAFLSQVSERYSLVLVDSAALPRRGGVPFFSDEDWKLLSRSLAPGGLLVMGGIRAMEGEPGKPLRAVITEGSRWFRTIVLYQREPVTKDIPLLPGEEEGVEAFLLFSDSGAPGWPQALAGFRVRNPGEA